MTKFKPGQKVLVKTSGYDPADMTSQMLQFVGEIVTISSNDSGNRNWPYRINEDPRWVWREDFFKHSDESVNPNFLFKMTKRR